jgi:hypothetical protein
MSWLVKFKMWRQQLSETIIQNPTTTVLIGLLLLGAYEFHEESRDLHQLCDLTGYHDYWTVNPTTIRQKINDICLGHDPDQGERPENP